jgi:uncharacterized protein (DUF1778 family)
MADKSDRIEVRVTREHKRLIEKAALIKGQPVTSFVLSSVLAKARETLERESRTVLSESDGRAFLRTLDEDRPPVSALVGAVHRAGRRGREPRPRLLRPTEEERDALG